MHKFILGTNPMAPDTGGTWIIHLPTPQTIIEVVTDQTKASFKSEYNSVSFVQNGIEIELRVLIIRGQNEEKIFKILHRAAHWYQSFLNHGKSN